MDTIRNEALAACGEGAAKDMKITGTMSGRPEARRIRRALRDIADIAARPDAPVWYPDNLYLARREGALAAEAFQKARRLAATAKGAAVSRLLDRFAQAGPISEQRLTLFLGGVRREGLVPESEGALVAAALRESLLLALAEGVPEAEAARLFTALRDLSELDLTEVLERSDPVDTLLRRDPDYPRMDEASRAAYRRRCQELGRRKGQSPAAVAEQALAQGLHEGLFARRELPGRLYIAANLLFTLCLSAAVGRRAESWLTALLLITPLSELVRTFMDALLLHGIKPRRLMRMALDGGVGKEGRCVCAVSVLLTDAKDGPAYARRLEQFRLANRDSGEDLLFALLADLPESEHYPPKGGAEALEAAQKAIEELNRRRGGGFFLLTREAVWNETDKVWMPKERKRGAITELARLLQGRDSALRCAAGDPAELYGSYILTLDADTRLVPGAARQLIGAALHPLNRPVVKHRVVIRGHGIIHPRMAVELSSAMATDFARIHVGQGGTDPYSVPSGELLFDMFGRGGFAGKGLIDARCYLECLEGRIPDNRVLSHDSIEGAYLRGAYMSDTELSDGAPVSAAKWFARLHRWTRGDWQNLPWLFFRGRDLSPVDRWRLFDSLRRSMVSVFGFAAIVLGFFSPKFRLCAAAALVCLAAQMLLDGLSRLFARPGDRRLRCRSGVLRGLGGSFTRLLSRLVLLPWEAFTCASAAATALWRMAVTHRHMLRWVTAAQSEGRRSFPAGLGFAMAAGALLLIFCPGSLGKAVGLIWLATPLFTLASGWQQKPQAEFGDSDRAFLRRSAEAIWDYFRCLCTEETGYLPPDNYQAQPPKGSAQRCSPTNIGLALLSALSALDLELCPRQEALELIENIMSTIEALPKWKGHLYNWYDNLRRTPLQPAYVSTVDSGNLCACLVCLGQGLRELGREDLARRAERLAEGMDLKALYDPKKKLFRIGLDPVRGELSPGHYDLLASEARLTSYLACARGDVPVKHWQSLSRAQLSLDGWRGLASWSGSVFEYLMPELFLPLEKGSLLWETARFCLYAQRRRARRAGAPWGNSESAFFSLDAGLDYRYKAHGTGALALRRDMDAELVVSPYSSFLALAVHPRAALKNLQKLRSMGLWGRFGFREAIDLTPGRSAPGGSVVDCFMVHHLGMSLTAIDNALCGGAMRRRFMAEPACAAFQSLLWERVPLGGAVIRRSRSPRTESEKHRPEAPAFSPECAAPDPAEPAFFPLSNGRYSLLAADDGFSRAQVGDLLMYRPDRFELMVDDRPVTPSVRRGLSLPWRYAGGCLHFFSARGETPLSCCLGAARGEMGELRRVTGPAGGRLELRFEPVLARRSDYEAHPSFWRLGLQCLSRDGSVLIRRLARGELPELWLCLSATVPLTVQEGLGWQMLHPIRIGARLPEGGCAALALCFGKSRDEALSGARRILSGDWADMAADMAVLLAMGAEGLRESFRLCAALARPRVCANALSRRENLWKQGLSGDRPIYLCQSADDANEAKKLLKRHALLTACGFGFDLVIDTGEGGDYLHPRAAALRRFMDRYGLAPFENAPGGIHFASDAAIAAAAVLPPAEPSDRALPRPVPKSLPGRSGAVPPHRWHDRGEFSFRTPPLPPRQWQNILANGALGFIATEVGGGHLWLENARECPVTAWDNDPLATGGSETLELWTAEGRRSLFADGRHPCRVRYGFGWARWEQPGCSVTAFIPGDFRARILLVEGGEGAVIAWHMGLRLSGEAADAPFVVTDMENGILSAHNPRSGSETFRLCAGKPFDGFTCDESSWQRGQADGRCGAGLRPCFGVTLPGGGMTVLVCGFEEPETLRALAGPERACRELMKLRDGWRSLLGRLRVNTPDGPLNDMLNGWAAYQCLSGRLLGRSSLYQSGGAYGFRDQLQDAVNLILLEPSYARKQILLCCRRQFEQGDVLHWWHEGRSGPRGVRSRCSDDLLWLVWALCEYTEKTGDRALCREETAWLCAAPLDDSEADRYFCPPATEEKSSVLEHARRALQLCLDRGTGPHGLLKTGSGDWNDGMDKVGGESQWLTLFFIHCARRFAGLLEKLGESGAEVFLAEARRLTAAAERAWDGRWYLRGYWQDGTPLGGAGAAGCALDSIAQSWAAFCPGMDDRRVDEALGSALEALYDEAHGLTKLFAPPFGDGNRDPGYIRSCGPGFRENGGQYTHGALWLASALLRRGRTQEGVRVLLACLPARHRPEIWAAEPYALAADVSANEDHYGEALWSWYTGSAGWFFRVATEDLLGLKLEEGHLRVEPRLPPDWNGFEADLGGRHVKVDRGQINIG